MKILINRAPIDGPWGGGNNFVSAFVDVLSTNGHEIVHSFEPEIDILFIQDPRPDSSGISINEIVQYKSKNPNSKIVQRINECDARKNTEHMDSLLLQCSQFLDKTIFVSDWMKDYFLKKGWKCNNNFSLHNGVNKEIFIEKKSKKSDLKSVVAHHWSNNLLKGFDAYEFLDYLAGKGLIKFTYIGRHRGSFDNTELIEPCHGEKLAKELAGHDVYISGSRFDPGPNHILEALAVGLPAYVHANGGGAVEFAGKSHTFKNLAELEKLILNKNFKKNEYDPITWKECIENYLKVLEK